MQAFTGVISRMSMSMSMVYCFIWLSQQEWFARNT